MSMKIRRTLVSVLFVAMILSGCGLMNSISLGKNVRVLVVYGSEKEEWLEPLVTEFNDSKQKTNDGSVIEIVAEPMGSIESVNAILENRLEPTVWSPASSIYIPIANAEWRKDHTEDLVVGDPNDLVLSPVVIAMWKSMAEVLGYPQKEIGWQDINRLALSDEGWGAYGYPEWGQFKFGHTHPGYSNSGLISIIAQAYAGSGKQRGLTQSDLNAPELAQFMSGVQSSIIHYGTSTGFFGNRMFERGPSYLSAAVLYENLVVNQESKRLAGTSSQIPVVAIYPKEGTFWANHPYAVLNAPWVTETQKEAAGIFEKYLLDRPQQLRAIQLGFRPADPSIALSAPLDAQHGVDPGKPHTVLEVPSSQVIRGIEELWQKTKKPVDLVIVMDTSGSMGGDKINAARSSLIQFINLLDDRDRLQVITFDSEIATLTPLSDLGEVREDLVRRVSGITEGGDTRLNDAVMQSYQDLVQTGDPKHIRAIVLLSDGQDTASTNALESVIDLINVGSEEGGGNAVKLFAIAYGDDADVDVLKKISEATGARQYDGNPETINTVYAEIATFF